MPKLKKILILDGQGGGLGAQLVRRLKDESLPGCEILCVGTNVLATNAMMKAGTSHGATGENAVIYNAGRADMILGPIGIIKANGIMGEVSPAMACAVSGADAPKILIPSNHCGINIAGVNDYKLDEYINCAIERAKEILEQGNG